MRALIAGWPVAHRTRPFGKKSSVIDTSAPAAHHRDAGAEERMERIHIDIRLEKAEWPSFAKPAVSLT